MADRLEGVTLWKSLGKMLKGILTPTAYAALKAVGQEEAEQQQRVSALVRVLKYIIDAAGFDLLNRVELKDRRTGRVYR